MKRRTADCHKASADEMAECHDEMPVDDNRGMPCRRQWRNVMAQCRMTVLAESPESPSAKYMRDMPGIIPEGRTVFGCLLPGKTPFRGKSGQTVWSYEESHRIKELFRKEITRQSKIAL